MLRLDTLDYRQVIKGALEDNRAEKGARFTLSRLAEHAGVQKTYMSRALAGEGRLSTDQIFCACRFLSCSPEETDYVITLAEYDRSTVKERREELSARITSFIKSRSRTEGYVDVELALPMSREAVSEYYLEPMAQIVHIALSVEAYARDPDLLRTRLGLSAEQLAVILDLLHRLNLVKTEGHRLRLLRDFLHLPVESPFYRNHSIRSRLHAIQKLTSPQAPDGYHFSVVFSADEAARSGVQKRLLEALAAAREQIEPAPSEHVYQLNIDLFAWL